MKVKNPWLAVLASIFVLPGLGHVLIGRTIKGLVIILGIGIYLPIIVVYLGITFSTSLGDFITHDSGLSLHLSGQTEMTKDFINAATKFFVSSIWLFLPLVFLWVYALCDLIITIKKFKLENKLAINEIPKNEIIEG